MIVQVTANGIYVIDCSTINKYNNNSSTSIVIPVYKPPDDIRISVVVDKRQPQATTDRCYRCKFDTEVKAE